ncbi:Stress responsive A/B Barrel Domain [Mycobacterium tuberculosis]|nr:Stress responsive A/B Barrel Domain [Mycobacterium tuberculosis]
MIEHVMLFWFQDSADPNDVATVLDGISRFTDIPSVDRVAVSENRGDPERSTPFTHAAILTFKGLVERDSFFVDERHVTLRKFAMTVFGELKTISVES